MLIRRLWEGATVSRIQLRRNSARIDLLKKSLTNDRFPSALEQALSWFVERYYKACLKNASSRMSDAGVLTCRFWGNFPERCRSPPSFRSACQPVS